MAQKFPEQAKMFANMTKTILELIKIGINDKTNIDGYKLRPTYHVTALFLGKDSSKTEGKIFNSYKPG
jgi:hypothetical protein